MMNKNELRDAFSKVQASDGLVEAVLLTQDCQKPKATPWRMARRVAACAAVLALLMGAMLFWDGTGEKAPFISVIVYADGENGVEIKLPDQNSAVSNVTDENDLSHSSGPLVEYDKTRFFFKILLNEYEKRYAGYKVYQDGKEVKRLNTKELSVGTAFVFEESPDDRKGQYTVSTETHVWGHTEKKTEIEIHYLKEGGDLLLKCIISVTPQEDDFLIVLEEVFVPEE